MPIFKIRWTRRHLNGLRVADSGHEVSRGLPRPVALPLLEAIRFVADDGTQNRYNRNPSKMAVIEWKHDET
jgi:hypothetical protein